MADAAGFSGLVAELAACKAALLRLEASTTPQLALSSPDPNIAMVIGGPMVTPVSSLILGTEASL